MDFRQKGRARETERDRPIGCLTYVARPGLQLATSSCALTGDRTHNLLLYEMMLQPQPTEPQGPGSPFFTSHAIYNFSHSASLSFSIT